MSRSRKKPFGWIACCKPSSVKAWKHQNVKQMRNTPLDEIPDRRNHSDSYGPGDGKIRHDGEKWKRK